MFPQPGPGASEAKAPSAQHTWRGLGPSFLFWGNIIIPPTRCLPEQRHLGNQGAALGSLTEGSPVSRKPGTRPEDVVGLTGKQILQLSEVGLWDSQSEALHSGLT